MAKAQKNTINTADFKTLEEAQVALAELSKLYADVQEENAKLKASVEAAKQTGVAMPTAEVGGKMYRVRSGVYHEGKSYSAQQIAEDDALLQWLISKGSGIVELAEEGGNDA